MKRQKNQRFGIVHENSTLGTNAGSAKFEYLPKKAYDNIKYLAERENKIYVLEGSLEIINENKDGKNLEAEIKLNSKSAILELPYIYYLGYSVYVDGNKLKTYESDNGFMCVEISKTDINKDINYTIENKEKNDDNNNDENLYSKLTLKYTGTILDNISKIISIIGAFIILTMLFNIKIVKNR